ncbi:MAG: DUF86 domain-containing protein [Nitrospirae bacterium]|nr:DUF86 domain-containing protein [Nitrospirota bacterium]
MRDDSAFVKHIIDEINYIIKETKDLDYATLTGNETLKRAVVRSLEIIGEATKNLSPEFKEKYPDVEWKEMAGLRDKLIHFYFGVDWDTVWDVIKNKIPELEGKLKKLLI